MLPSGADAWLPRVARRASGQPPTCDRYCAALLAVDITGFTRLTDRLEREGDRGVEEVAALLDDRFGLVIDCVTKHRGDVLRFAGDALVAGWLYGGDEQERVRAAVEAGLDIQRLMGSRSVAADVPIELRSGVALGDLLCLHLGRSRRAFVTVGPVLAEAHAAEGLARPGSLVVGPSAAALLRNELVGSQLDGGFVKVEALAPVYRVRREEPAESSAATLPPSLELLRSYLPEVVQGRLAAGQQDWLAELRPLSVAFFQIPVDPTKAREMDEVLGICQRVVARYEGSIDKLLCDEKGTSLLMVWGLPPYAHEDGARRAVRAAMELRQIFQEDLGLPALLANCGIATGSAFCGPVGNELRREYTVIGSVVNLAARLMQAASGRGIVLCDDATRLACQGRLHFEGMPPIQAKGFEAPLATWSPVAERQRTLHAHSALVGRRTELARLLQWMQGEPPENLLVLEGPMGIGKTRLLDQSLLDAEEIGLHTVFTAADPVERNTPYYSWRRILADSVEESDDPLLKGILGMEEEGGTLDLGQEQRASRVRHLVERKLAVRGPMILIFDNAHWMDSASWALLQHLVHSLTGLRALLLLRPDAGNLPPKARALLLDATRLSLGPLSAPEVADLVADRLKVSKVAPEVVGLIQLKAQGNPFFVEQLLGALRDTGLVTVRGESARMESLQGLVIPDTVQAAILARLDRLDPEDQLLLKVASVAGPTFSLPLLSSIHPIPADVPSLPDRLQQLSGKDLLEPTPQGYSFRHPLTREVAYERLLLAQRRSLHGAVAQWMEGHVPEGGLPYALLGWHHGEAGNPEKAIDYLEKAGERAMQDSAAREVVDLYERALFLASSLSLASSRLGWWHRQLGEAWCALGDLGKAQHHLSLSLQNLGYPLPPLGIRFGFHLAGQLLTQLGHRLWPPRSDGPQVALMAAIALERLAEIHFFTAEAFRSVYCSFRALNLSERVIPSDVTVRNLATVGGTLGGAMNLHKAADRYLERASRLAIKLEQPAAGSWVELIEGLYRIGTGDWNRAIEKLQQSGRRYQELGALRRQEECLHHLGWAYVGAGDLERSRQVYEELRALARRSGDAQARAWALCGLAEVDLRMGLPPQELEEALQETRRCGDLLEEGKAMGLSALAEARAGRPNVAEERLNALLRLASGLRLSFFHGGFDLAVEAVALLLSGGHRAALRQGKGLLTQLALLSLTQPIAQPAYHRLRATLLQQEGRVGAATQAQERSRQAAQKLAMPLAMQMVDGSAGQ